MPKQSDIFFAGGAGAIAVNGFDGIWKTYTEADVTVTSTATNFALYAGDNHFKPYKDKNGNWFLDFIIAASQDAIGSHTMTIHGADAKPTNVSQDASAVYLDQQGISGSGCKAYSDGAGNTAILHFLGATTARTRVSGTVALNGKPTWADFDPDASVLVSTYNQQSGDYIPSINSISANASSISNPVGSFYRFENKVFVNVKFSYNQDSTGNTTFDISLPIASTFTSIDDVQGTCAAYRTTITNSGGIVETTISNTNARAYTVVGATSTTIFAASFSYTIK